jgi:hypothetical protein
LAQLAIYLQKFPAIHGNIELLRITVLALKLRSALAPWGRLALATAPGSLHNLLTKHSFAPERCAHQPPLIRTVRHPL